jgi:hypothetical protein
VPDTDNEPGWTLRVWQVDPAAIERAGSGGAFHHMRFQPVDGSFLTAWSATTPGAPTWAVYWVDIAAVTKAGTGGVWNHLAAVPVPAPVPPC